MAIITPGTTNQAAASNTPAGQATIGKVVILQGQVQATAADGTVRILSPNSLVFANDHIVTGSDGNLSLFIVGNPPTQMDIGRMSNVTLDEDVYSPVSATPSTDTASEVASLQEALLRGEDITQMEATAAGPGAGGALGGAHPTVSFDLTANEIDPTSGAETTGLQYAAMDTIQSDALALADAVPDPEPDPERDPDPEPVRPAALNAYDNVAVARETVDVSSSTQEVTKTLETGKATAILNLQNADGNNERSYNENNSPLKMTIPGIEQDGNLIITLNGSSLGSQQELRFDIFDKDGNKTTVTFAGKNTSTVSVGSLGEGPYTMMLVYAKLPNFNNDFGITGVKFELQYTETTNDTYTYTYDISGNVIDDQTFKESGNKDVIYDSEGKEVPFPDANASVSGWSFTNPYTDEPIQLSGDDTYTYADNNVSFTITFSANGDYVFTMTSSEAVSIDNFNIRYTVEGEVDGESVSGSADLYIRGEEHVILGSDDDDVLQGGAGNNIIYGGAGNDTIIGGDGNDVIYGGSGNNELWGGAGADTFVISANSNNLIMDYDILNGDVLDIKDVIKSGDTLRIEDDGGKLKVSIVDWNTGDAKASVTFDSIDYAGSGFTGDAANDIALLSTLIDINY